MNTCKLFRTVNTGVTHLVKRRVLKRCLFQSVQSHLFQKLQNPLVPMASHAFPQNAQRVNTAATVFSERIVNCEDVKRAENDSNTLIIDVREPHELQETGVIPGSVNIPLADVESVLAHMPNDEFRKRYGRQKPNKNFRIIFSCRSGKRSSAATEMAQKLGYTNIHNYIGGWLDWEENCKTRQH